MSEDKKDVATKLKARLQHLLSVVEDPEKTNDRSRLGVSTDSADGLAALRKVFERQISAQFGAHGLPEDVFRPITEGETLPWNSPWMQHMTMWLDAMVDELEETRNWLNWKCWKKPTPADENKITNARFELIDLLHFWISAYYMLGGTPETLVAEYHAKRDENDERQRVGY